MSELCSLETPNAAPTRDTGVKANTEEEETVNRTLRVAGYGRQHASTVQRSKLGTLWIPTSGRFPWCSGLRREFISGGEGFRVSDEAVVSDDPSGQHNPMVSQGPLDGRVGVAGSRAILNRKALERVIPSGITYSWELQLRWRIRRPHGADVDGT